MEPDQTNINHDEASVSLKVVLLIFAIVLILALGYLVYAQNRSTWDTSGSSLSNKTSESTSTSDNTSDTNGSSSGTTTTKDNLSCPDYVNTTYGFSLTFPSEWDSCHFKTADVTGATKVIYVELPTTSDIYAHESTTNEAGYVSLFAISVYTPDQWTTEQALDQLSTIVKSFKAVK